MVDTATFGATLDQQIKARNLSQRTVLGRLKNHGVVIHRSTLSKWLSGDRKPRDRNVVLTLAKVLGCGLATTNTLLRAAGLTAIQPGEADLELDSILLRFSLLEHKVYYLKQDLGWSDSEVAGRTGIREGDVWHYVQTVERHLCDERGPAGYLQLRHIAYLSECMETIRKLLYDPVRARAAGASELPMQVYGTDWRLLPRLWFMFTTPDLSEPALPYWGEELPQLQQHLKGNAFWSAWKNLASSADSLEKVYLDAMSRVLQVPVEQVPNGLPRELRFIAARVPDNLSDMMPPEPPYSIEDYNRVMSWIQADNPATYDDILARQQDLETRLCRLNDCIRDKLATDNAIYRGKCDACLSFRP